MKSAREDLDKLITNALDDKLQALEQDRRAKSKKKFEFYHQKLLRHLQEIHNQVNPKHEFYKYITQAKNEITIEHQVLFKDANSIQSAIDIEKLRLLAVSAECVAGTFTLGNMYNQNNLDILNALNERLATRTDLGRSDSFGKKFVGAMLIIGGILAIIVFGIAIAATQGAILKSMVDAMPIIKPVLDTLVASLSAATSFLSSVLPFSLPAWLLPTTGVAVSTAATVGGIALNANGHKTGLLGATSTLFNKLTEGKKSLENKGHNPATADFADDDLLINQM